MRHGEPYCPSNGTEGEGFMARWCNRCKRDRAFQDSGGEEPGCEIISASMAYNVRDPKYPKEWVWQDGRPVCTAFDNVSERITNAERDAQMPLL